MGRGSDTPLATGGARPRTGNGMASGRRGSSRHGKAATRHVVFREGIAAGLHELADPDFVPSGLDGRPISSPSEKREQLVAVRESFPANTNIIGMDVNAAHPEGRPRKRLKAALVELHEQLGVDVWWQDDADKCCRTDGATSHLDFHGHFDRRNDVSRAGDLSFHWRPAGAPRFTPDGRHYQPSDDELRTAIDVFQRHGVPAIAVQTTDDSGLPATRVELHKVGPVTPEQLTVMEQGYSLATAQQADFDVVKSERYTEVLGRHPSAFLLRDPAPLQPEELAAWRARTGNREVWDFERLGNIPPDLVGLAGGRLFGDCHVVSTGPDGLRFATAQGKEWTLARRGVGSPLNLSLPAGTRLNDLPLTGDLSHEQATALLGVLDLGSLREHGLWA